MDRISITGQPVKSLGVKDTKQRPKKIAITAITTMVMITIAFLITIIYVFYLLTWPYNTNQNKQIKKNDKKRQKMAGTP